MWAEFCIFAHRFKGGESLEKVKNSSTFNLKIMATFNYFINESHCKEEKRMEIHVRFRDGRKYDLKYGTGLFINNSNWDMEKKMPKDKRSAKYSDECDEIR